MTTTTAQVPLYKAIARALEHKRTVFESPNPAWDDEHTNLLRFVTTERLKGLLDELPSGSGWDNGTTLDDRSTPQRLIFTGAYHHMNDGGMYDGWTEHEVIVTPSLTWDVDIRITGRNRNGIKEYLAEMFQAVLTELIDEYQQVPAAPQGV